MRLAGFGQVKVEATKEEKINLTKQAKGLVSASQVQTGPMLLALESSVRALLAKLDSLQAFEDSSFFEIGSWDSSQTIRANLQAAINNIRVRSGVREGTVHSQQRDVSVAAETVSNVASRQFVKDVETQARKMTGEAGKSLQKGWSLLTWLEEHKTWLLILVTLLIIGYVVRTGTDLAKLIPFVKD